MIQSSRESAKGAKSPFRVQSTVLVWKNVRGCLKTSFETTPGDLWGYTEAGSLVWAALPPA